MKEKFCTVIFFLLGGIGYFLIEILWRGHSHWTMFLLGGLCFVLLGKLASFHLPLWKKCILGSAEITLLEFLSGCVFNLRLGWGIWNYEDVPMNLLGQICLPFTGLWFLLCVAVIPLAEILRKSFSKK